MTMVQLREGAEQVMERHHNAMLTSLFSLLLCAPASSALLQSVSNCQTELSADVKQSVGKPYVSEIT